MLYPVHPVHPVPRTPWTGWLPRPPRPGGYIPPERDGVTVPAQPYFSKKSRKWCRGIRRPSGSRAAEIGPGGGRGGSDPREEHLLGEVPQGAVR